MTDGGPTAIECNDLWAAAERLRTVRRAHERFLALWAVDRLLDAPAAAARAWADAGRASDNAVGRAVGNRSWSAPRWSDD